MSVRVSFTFNDEAARDLAHPRVLRYRIPPDGIPVFEIYGSEDVEVEVPLADIEVPKDTKSRAALRGYFEGLIRRLEVAA